MAKSLPVDEQDEILEPRIYEIGYLLSPVIRSEDLEAAEKHLQSLVTDLGGSIISEGSAEYIDLAYTMVKVLDNKNVRFNQAYFGWVKFELDPAKVEALKEILDRQATLIRYLFLSTVRENTVLSKKPLSKILRREDRGSIESEEEVSVSDGAEVSEKESEAVVDESPVVESQEESSISTEEVS